MAETKMVIPPKSKKILMIIMIVDVIKKVIVDDGAVKEGRFDKIAASDQ
jgi:hypothetical protein